MKVELITEADRVLNACGRPIPGAGAGWVEIPKGILYAKYLAAGVAPTTEERLVETPVPFLLKAIQGFQNPPTLDAVLWRLRFPDGSDFQSRNATCSEGLDYGSFRLAIDPPVLCDPGSRFWVTVDGLTNNSSNATSLNLVLEGVLRYSIRGGAACGVAPALRPRYVRDQNQNILAPEWRLGNQCYPETPVGFFDKPYTYATPLVSLVQVPWTGVIVPGVKFPMESDTEFVARSFATVTNSATGGSTGNVAVRIRRDDGYEVTDGFTLARRISGPMFPELPIKPHGALYIDYQVFGGLGAVGGVLLVQTFVSGVKRRRLQ